MAANPPGWAPKPNKVVPRTPTKYAKVNLKTEDFNDLIKAQGVRVKVFRTVFCPNVKSVDGAEHDIECPLCYGSQFVDCYPIETMAFIQGQSLDKKVFSEGLYDNVSVSATFLQGIALQYFTLVELMDFTEVFIDRIKRQRGQMDVLRYPATAVNFLIDSNGRHYYQGSDFNLDFNGCIVWCANKGPLAGTIYSVNYDHLIRYRATNAMHVNRFGQINNGDQAEMVALNHQWALTSDFLVNRKDAITKMQLPDNKNRDYDSEE